MFIGIAFKILLNVGALWAAGRYVPGFHIVPADFFGQLLQLNPIEHVVPFSTILQDFSLPLSDIGLSISPAVQTIALGGIVLAVINAALYPFLKVIAAILPLVTTPMLLVALNAILLYASTSYLPTIALDGFKPLILTALLFGIVNSLP